MHLLMNGLCINHADGPSSEQQALTPVWSCKVQLKPGKGSSTEEQPPGATGGSGAGSGVAAGGGSSSSSSAQVLLTLQTDLPSSNGEPTRSGTPGSMLAHVAAQVLELCVMHLVAYAADVENDRCPAA